MSFSLTQKNIMRIIGSQIALLLTVAMLVVFLMNKNTGFSVLLGGLSCWVPTALFAWGVFSVRHFPSVFLVFFMLGELIKLFLGAMLLVLAITFFPVKILPVLVGFIGAIVSFWVASLCFLF